MARGEGESSGPTKSVYLDLWKLAVADSWSGADVEVTMHKRRRRAQTVRDRALWKGDESTRARIVIKVRRIGWRDRAQHKPQRQRQKKMKRKPACPRCQVSKPGTGNRIGETRP